MTSDDVPPCGDPGSEEVDVTKKAAGPKKLSLKRETVKDLDAGRKKPGELGDGELDRVNGGGIVGPGGRRPLVTQVCPAVLPGPERCPTLSKTTAQVFTVQCPTFPLP